MRNTRWFATTLAVAFAILPVSVSAQNIDTRDDDSYVWGGSGIYGQSFTVGTLTGLTSFSFWVGANDANVGGTGPYQFFAQLYAWDGTSIVGGDLYTSGVLDAVCCDDLVPPRFDFNVGTLSLVSGAQYLALIARTSPGGLKVGYVRGPSGFIDSYPGGAFIGGSSGAGAPDPATASYFPIAFAPGNDLMFTASFNQVTAVPEPSTLALFVSAVFALALARRRLRR